MTSLTAMLSQRTHRDLELIARAHRLPFTRRLPKAQGLATLTAALHAGAYQRAFKTLTSTHLEALQALVVAGGCLPLAKFTRHFGEIRLYKPWRKGLSDAKLRLTALTHPARATTRHPWRYPLSVAERLYHLGFIWLDAAHQQVEIVAEVKVLLPPLPQPVGTTPALSLSPSPSASTIGAFGRGGQGVRLDLLRDLAAFLGVLLLVDATPIHGRWLSLDVLHTLNQRLHIKEDLRGIRSELQTGRLRWLHYLGQISDLVSLQAGVLKPTVEAWRWLAAPSQVQWDLLMQAVEADLEICQRYKEGWRSRGGLWTVFRLPEVTAEAWRVVRHTLDDLAPTHAYQIRDVFALWKPYLLPDRVMDIGYLLRDVFAWCGVVRLSRGEAVVSPPLRNGFAPPTPEATVLLGKNADFSRRGAIYCAPTDAILSFNLPNVLSHNPEEQGEEGWSFPLPTMPSAAFVTLLSFIEVENGSALLNPQSITNAVKQGLALTEIIGTLNTLLAEPLSIEIQHQLQTWFQSAQRLTLQPMIVLHASDADLMQQIRGDWRLAEHFHQRLSPHHLAVVAEDADKLLSRLHRRGLTVTSRVRPSSQREITETLTSDMAEYLLLAVRTYQGLHQRLGASIRIPKALAQWLTAQVSNPASIEASAAVLVDAVQQYVALPVLYCLSGDEHHDFASIRQQVLNAHHQHQPLMIDYRSPTADHPSTHTIEIDELYESNDVTYIEAFCASAGKVLTFRMDRILRVQSVGAQHVAPTYANVSA